MVISTEGTQQFHTCSGRVGQQIIDCALTHTPAIKATIQFMSLEIRAIGDTIRVKSTLTK